MKKIIAIFSALMISIIMLVVFDVGKVVEASSQSSAVVVDMTVIPVTSPIVSILIALMASLFVLAAISLFLRRDIKSKLATIAANGLQSYKTYEVGWRNSSPL